MAVRIRTSLWADPEWLSLTYREQLFIFACIAVGATGACSDERLARHTGWGLDFIQEHRVSVSETPFAPLTIGRVKRRKLPRALVRQVMERDGWTCRSCGAIEALQIDHIHPVARGGSDDLSNLQTLCKSCNLKKGARLA